MLKSKLYCNKLIHHSSDSLSSLDSSHNVPTHAHSLLPDTFSCVILPFLPAHAKKAHLYSGARSPASAYLSRGPLMKPLILHEKENPKANLW